MIKKSVKIIISLLFLSWAGYFSACFTVILPTFHLDGAFQTASQLFRLDAEQTFGQDFFSYLGVGVITSLYPFFKVFGSNLAASIFASHFITILFSCFSLTIVYRTICPTKSLLTCFCICGTSYCVIISLYTIFSVEFPLIDYHLIDYSLYPGNSLRSIRAFIPYLVTLLLILSPDSFNRFLLRSLFFGLVLLWSNDYGFSTFLCYIIARIYFLHAKSKSLFLIFSDILSFILLALASYLILISLITHNSLIKFLRYTIDVSKDQFWYFSPYTSNSRIFNFSDLLSSFHNLHLYPSTLILIFIIAMVYTKKSHIYSTLAFIGISSLMGGVVASVGGHIDSGYFYSFRFWTLMVLFSSALKALELLLIKLKATSSIILITLIMSFALLLNGLFYFHKYETEIYSYENDSNYIYVAELGGYLPKEWNDYVKLARKNENRVCVEEYWGIWSAINKSIPIWPVDSVIHALGQTRNLAQQEIENTELVITTKPSLSGWQLWSFNQNFWFYNKIISEFTPIYYSPATVVWQRNSKVSLIESASKQCLIKEKNIKVLSKAQGFYKINLNYEIKQPRRILLMVKNNYPVGSYISLDPSSNHALFPIWLDSQSPNFSFDIDIIGKKKSKLIIKSCHAEYINLDDFVNSGALYSPYSQ